MKRRTSESVSVRAWRLLAVAALVALMAPAGASGLEILFPYAFADRFPGSSQHLGYEKGTRLAIGAYVDGAVEEATATQLDTGVQYPLEFIQLGLGTPFVQAIPMPALDVALHAGLWVVEVSDAAGNQAQAEVYLGPALTLPFVKQVSASLDPAGSVITVRWRAPKDQPEDCFLTAYGVRIQSDFWQQFFNSDFLLGDSALIPVSELPADWEGLWVRIENFCVTSSGFARSNTFRPLLDLLAEP